MPSKESFQPWLTRPRSVARRYSRTAPSGRRRSSIHSSARSAAGSSRATAVRAAPTGAARPAARRTAGWRRPCRSRRCPPADGRPAVRAEPHLVQDPAGLFLGQRVDSGPWQRASVCSVPRATVGSSGRAIQLVSSASGDLTQTQIGARLGCPRCTSRVCSSAASRPCGTASTRSDLAGTLSSRRPRSRSEDERESGSSARAEHRGVGACRRGRAHRHPSGPSGPGRRPAVRRAGGAAQLARRPPGAMGGAQ